MTDLINPGIYFGLPADRYHADPAIGSSFRKALALDPIEAQQSRLNPPKEESAWLLWGQAWHTRVLDGKEAFDRTYKIDLDPEEYRKRAHDSGEEFLVSMDDLRGYAAELGIKVPRTKSDAIEAIRIQDSSVFVWDEIVAQYERDTRKNITRKMAAEIEQATEWMQADALLNDVMENGCFTGGAPEVSVFYNKNGIRLKARFDYLMNHAIVDLKSFRPWGNKTVEQGVIQAITDWRYDLQAAAYIEAWLAAKEMWTELGPACIQSGYSAEEGKLLWTAFDENEKPVWIWVFLKATGAPQPLVVEISHKTAPFVLGAAEEEIATALERYSTYREQYGEDKSWPPRHKAMILDDTSFPPWFGRSGR